MLGATLLFSLNTLLAQDATARSSRIVGIVVDSIHKSGLEGADVIVSGMSSPVTTDALGRFTIDSLAPGTYQVGVFHPLIESLGLTLASKPFSVGRDSTGVVNLAIPPVTTLASRYCGAATAPKGTAVVAGRVLDPDNADPLPGATILLSWVDMTVSRQAGVRHTPHELRTESDSAGAFKFCGLPNDLDASLEVTRSGVSTGEVEFSTRGAPFTFENLAIARSSAALGRGMVRGTVLSVDNRPVGNARVEAPGRGVAVVTKDDGTFNLDGVPIGTQLIIVRRLGFEPARINVNVSSRQPTDLKVTLGPSAPVLDAVLVTARRNYALEKSGFVARQRAGWGKYFTREQIQKANPYNLTDFLSNVPGIQVVHGLGGASVNDRRVRTILGGGRGGGCTHIWIDGFEWNIAEAGDIDAFVSPGDIIGLEVYKEREIPVQYMPRADQTCPAVVILVWTR
jgi:hypothetical protein